MSKRGLAERGCAQVVGVLYMRVRMYICVYMSVYISRGCILPYLYNACHERQYLHTIVEGWACPQNLILIALLPAADFYFFFD